MKINVTYIPTDVKCQFVQYGNGMRLWIRGDGWFPSVGWCPHINLSFNECDDCALALEDDREE